MEEEDHRPMEEEEEDAEEKVSNLKMGIDQGNTFLRINAASYDVLTACNIYFEFRFPDLSKGQNAFQKFDIQCSSLKVESDEDLRLLQEGRLRLLPRELLSDKISDYSKKKKKKKVEDNTNDMTSSLLRTWEESIYFLLDYALCRMCRDAPSPLGVRRGAFFQVDLYQSSTSEDGASVFACPSNLLRRHEPDKDDCSSHGSNCAICLEEFEGEGGDGDSTCLPCSHAFHCGCLAEWLPKSLTCPLCRYEMDDWYINDWYIKIIRK